MKGVNKFMNKKVIPVTSPNNFIAYKPFDASRISILLAQETLCKEIYENFLYFRIEKKVNNKEINLDCHFNEEFSSIGVKKIPTDVIKDLNIEFIKFCKISLERDFYIFLPIETSEITNYINYKKKLIPHHIFIYGYNDDKKVFYCSEFFSFSEAPYSSQIVTYQEMEAAYYKLQSLQKSNVMDNEWAQWMKDIQLLHSFTEYIDKFDIKRLIIGLQNYLDGNDCSGNKNYIKDVYYGFAIYDLVAEYIKEKLISYQKNFDIRCFTLIFYRFHYMKLQTIFIKENYVVYGSDIQFFIDSYSDIEKEAYIMLNLIIKFTISEKKDILIRVCDLMERIKRNDLVVTRSYIECLKSIKS